MPESAPSSRGTAYFSNSLAPRAYRTIVSIGPACVPAADDADLSFGVMGMARADSAGVPWGSSGREDRAGRRVIRDPYSVRNTASRELVRDDGQAAVATSALIRR